MTRYDVAELPVRHILLVGAAALVFFASACSQGTAVRNSADTLRLEGARACLDHPEGPAVGQLCIDPDSNGSGFLVKATGLESSSVVNIEGSDGSILNSSAAADGEFRQRVSGQIVAADFAVRATWADGQPVSVTADLPN